MASKWLSITFFYKSIPIYPGKSRTIPESQLGRTMFLLTQTSIGRTCFGKIWGRKLLPGNDGCFVRAWRRRQKPRRPAAAKALPRLRLTSDPLPALPFLKTAVFPRRHSDTIPVSCVLPLWPFWIPEAFWAPEQKKFVFVKIILDLYFFYLYICT